MGLFSFFRRRKKESKGKVSADGKKGNDTPQICFVLCLNETVGNLSGADAIVKDVLGDDFSAEASDKSIVMISHDDSTIGFLAHMPMPVPGGEAEDNVDGNFLWPDGKAEVALHRSHVIVTQVGAGQEDPIAAAIALAKLTLVALKLFDGMGVYWGNANVCNNRETFENFCDGMSEDHIPLPVMLRFQFFGTDDNQIGMYTLGMKQFGLMELEVESCRMQPADLFEYIGNVAHYLVRSGPVIKDGNTIGTDAEERIVVRHRPSMLGDNRLVYKILFE